VVCTAVVATGVAVVMGVGVVEMTVVLLLLLLLPGVVAPSSSCMQQPPRQLLLLGEVGSQEGRRETWGPDLQLLVRRVECRVRIQLGSIPEAAAAGKSLTAAATTPQVLALRVWGEQSLGPGVPLQQQQGQDVGLVGLRLVVPTLLHILLRVQRGQLAPWAAARAGSSTSLPAGPRKLSDCCRRCMLDSENFTC
jgi:hypothetical protein